MINNKYSNFTCQHIVQIISIFLFLVFIYSMPGYSCSIKERMLYSSCKAPLLDLIQSLGVIIAKKVSIYLIL